MDYWYGLQELQAIIDRWIKDQPEFGHFEVKQIRRTWIICECENRKKFTIGKENVEVFDGTQGADDWNNVETILAADPQFFEKLHKLLVEACVVAQAHIKLNEPTNKPN